MGKAGNIFLSTSNLKCISNKSEVIMETQTNTLINCLNKTCTSLLLFTQKINRKSIRRAIKIRANKQKEIIINSHPHTVHAKLTIFVVPIVSHFNLFCNLFMSRAEETVRKMPNKNSM